MDLENLKNHRARIDALLKEGLESGPATPMTAQDWQGIREEVFGKTGLIEEAEAAWEVEVARRVDDIQSGKVVGKPAEQLFEELRKQYS